jgi:cellulose biosynthesis protein BcsQ
VRAEGGVGKTTTAMFFAAAAADTQGSDLTAIERAPRYLAVFERLGKMFDELITAGIGREAAKL